MSLCLIILRIIAAGHPIGVNESLIIRVLKSLTLDHSQMRIRAELRHLCADEAIEIIDQGEDGWAAKLTVHGIGLAGIANRKSLEKA